MRSLLLLIGLALFVPSVHAKVSVESTRSASPSEVSAVDQPNDFDQDEDERDFTLRFFFTLWFSSADAACDMLQKRLDSLDSDEERNDFITELLMELGFALRPEWVWSDPGFFEDVPARLLVYAPDLRSVGARHAQAMKANRSTLDFLDMLEVRLPMIVKPREDDSPGESPREFMEFLRIVGIWRLGNYTDAANRMSVLSKSFDLDKEDRIDLREAMSDPPAPVPGQVIGASFVIEREKDRRFRCGVAGFGEVFSMSAFRADRLRAEGRLDDAIAILLADAFSDHTVVGAPAEAPYLAELLRERYTLAQRREAWRHAEDSLWLDAHSAQWTLFGSTLALPYAVQEKSTDGVVVTPMSREELLELLRKSSFHKAMMRD